MLNLIQHLPGKVFRDMSGACGTDIPKGTAASGFAASKHATEADTEGVESYRLGSGCMQPKQQNAHSRGANRRVERYTMRSTLEAAPFRELTCSASRAQ